MKKLLVLGGGIGGVEAAIALVKAFKGKLGYQVELISDRDELFIYPLSVWIPVGRRKLKEISMSLAELAKRRGFHFRKAKVLRIENQARKVVTDLGEQTYDYLVIALGADKLKPLGVEHTLSICGGGDEAVRIGERFRQVPEGGTIACGFAGNPKDSTGVRGGPVFEVLFNLDAQLRREKKRDKYKLIFFSPAADAGKRLGGPGMHALEKLFAERGIEPLLGKKIREFRPDGIVWEDGSVLSTQLTLFTPGLQGPTVLKSTDLPLTEAGFIPVNTFGQVDITQGNTANKEYCYVIGDSAAFAGPDWRAKQGHFAEAMARVAAQNIRRQEDSLDPNTSFDEHFNVLCVMDLGKDAIFVYRDAHRAFAPRGVWAHWAKLGWEWYYKWNKKGWIPNLPL